MVIQSCLTRQSGFNSVYNRDAFRGIVPAAVKSGKGFGGVRKSEEHKPKDDRGQSNDRQTFKEAAAAITTHRPVRPEEAARGKLDYVQVADWGNGDRSKLGELRLVSHVQQYEGSASGTSPVASKSSDSGGSGSGGESGGARPFHMQLARQLQLAEARGALAVAGPPPPPVSEWSFREQRYMQYLADQLAVHEALEAALLEATASIATNTATSVSQLASGGGDGGGGGGGGRGSTSRVGTTAAAAPPPLPPVQDAVHALLHLIPGRLGLERSGAIRRDLEALRATAGHPAAAASAAAAPRAASDLDSQVEAAVEAAVVALASGSVAPAVPAEVATNEIEPCVMSAPTSMKGTAAGPMARSYVQVLRRLGRVTAAGEDEKERQLGALRLLAHTGVVHLVGQAVWVRLGATATERLALLQRRAAATYQGYPREVADPRVTLSRALDAAGEHLRLPAARQVVFDEVASAMQKTGLLLSALAHRD